MASQPKVCRVAIDRILLATDFSPESENALSYAANLAQRFASTVSLTHVLTAEDFTSEGTEWQSFSDAARRSAEKKMARLSSSYHLDSITHDAVIRSGNPCDTITQMISEQKIDLVVMGTHGDAAIKKLFLGSTAENVIRHSHCPVLTVGPHVEVASLSRFNHILYATDFSAGSMRALNYALLLAEEDRSDLTLLHVIESLPADADELHEWRRQDRERLLKRMPPDADLAYRPEVEIETGTPAVEILRLADSRKVDLIVMGSHAGGAMATHMPWTTLHDVLRNARCPVLTVCAQ